MEETKGLRHFEILARCCRQSKQQGGVALVGKKEGFMGNKEGPGLWERKKAGLMVCVLVTWKKGLLAGIIPSEIGNLPRLEMLSIHSGSLAGTIPSSIFNISSLKIIDFINNSLFGNLPVNIHCDFPVLEALYLSSYLLTGEIPSNLWECRGLQELALSDNKFTGNISKNIENITFLKALYLDGNGLKGTLPNEIGNLNLEGFSIHENNLSGLIPSNIFNVTTMKIFDLNDNQFSGHLPSTMGFWLPNLEELSNDPTFGNTERSRKSI
ncbi:LRR receptor-like serine/threonine-protein kinase FLS2 [Cornus florida]|uniref:LRR receptor-like serine/threonine-protein kinase FLS2 n=1 Tax=Cornus florida TaxID=4283 RepID=UPI00289BB57C|nr:LRR receptor-like serine/threonine-protein kinase FLS2 [Cornus florida]